MGIDLRPSWLDADLELYRDNVLRFVETEMLPADEAARARGHVGHDLWRRAGQLGLLCSDIPEAWGGGGGDFRHEAVLYDAMARRALSGMSATVHSIVAHYFLNHGTEAQKQRWLPAMARGEVVGAIAMTEPGTGSDLQAVRTRAERRGDHYVLNGSKTFISNGYLAGVVLVVAKTDPALGSKGISILIVDTQDAPGFRVGRVLDKIGQKAQDTSELFFDEMRIPASAMLGEEGKGFELMMTKLAQERLAQAIRSAVVAETVIGWTVDYTANRKAFGKTIGDFQNTQFKLAELQTEATVGRVFTDQCIAKFMKGELDAVDAAMAKMWLSNMHCKVVDECLQLFGGWGYMWEYPIARAYADARIVKIAGGSIEVMKHIIGRKMFAEYQPAKGANGVAGINPA